MVGQELLSEQDMLSCLSRHYNMDVIALTCLPLGADMNAAVYKVETHDEAFFFVKVKRGEQSNIEILELLRAAGIQQIIAPLKTIHGQTTQRIENFSLSVYPFVEGQDGFQRDLSAVQWVLLGATLRQVHHVVVPLEIQAHLRRESFSPRWREAVGALYRHREAGLKGDEFALRLLALMRERKPEILCLVDRAEQLAKELTQQSHQFVLCHSDIHGGNVLMQGNDSLYLVDWDEPIMAPRERDLMFIGGGVANVWNRPREVELFYEGYGNTTVNTALLSYYRHERIVEDIALLGRELLLTKAGDRPQMYKHLIDMFEPRGVIDIAFKTDAG
jgi:spectinomycin phosphotransferase